MSFLVGAKKLFNDQRCGARRRGIGWAMTFDEWLRIWVESGKYDERGRGLNRYCMARHGDIGPYAIGNVTICTNQENCRKNAAPVPPMIPEWVGPCEASPYKEFLEQTIVRDQDICDLRRSGLTLEEIGRRYCLTRQRVHQILSKQP